MELTDAKLNGMSPAFPQDPRIWVDGLGGCHTEAVGMTKREEFAKAALQGFCANIESILGSIPKGMSAGRWLAVQSVIAADEILKELEPKK
jgi:hypothetical protein